MTWPLGVSYLVGKAPGGETGDASHTHGLPGVDGVSWTAPLACRDLRLWGGLWQLLVFSEVQALVNDAVQDLHSDQVQKFAGLLSHSVFAGAF